ncbi:MAG: Na(+)/H(+) antiporter subunit B [Bacteroidota bacterium]|nr:Na(+)/H(+) antiporter subunit B [Bacteroidota bacterium]
MVKNAFIFVLLLGFVFLFFNLFADFSGNTELNELASHYADSGHEEVGAANLVTAVIVTYRGLDTLGEVTILFLSAAIVSFLLKIETSTTDERKLRATSEILDTASKVLVPVIFLFGIYVFINGHLTPGGGFQGGAIIASGLVLILLSKPLRQISHRLISIIESISGLSFVLLGVAGILFAAGFLDNRILSLGEFGTIFSAGLIPIIYIFVGLKVGAELSSIITNLQENQNEA